MIAAEVRSYLEIGQFAASGDGCVWRWPIRSPANVVYRPSTTSLHVDTYYVLYRSLPVHPNPNSNGITKPGAVDNYSREVRRAFVYI